MTRRQEFTRKTKEARWEFCGGKCEAVHDGVVCGEVLIKEKVEYHHDVECEMGGDNSFENCRAVSKACHVILTSKFIGLIRKGDRIRAIQINAKTPSPNPLPCGRKSPWKAKVQGGKEPRHRPPSEKTLPRRYPFGYAPDASMNEQGDER